MRAIEFRNIALVADDADAMPQVWLEVYVRSGSDERQHLAALIHERELRCAGPPGDDRPQDANCVIRTAGGRCRNASLLRRLTGWHGLGCSLGCSRASWIRSMSNLSKPADFVHRNLHGIAIGCRLRAESN